MVISYTKVLINVVLLVHFVGIVSTDILVNKLKRVRTLPYNCVEAVRAAGSRAKSGIYQIRLPLDGWVHRPFNVYCLLDHNGGDPWLLVQRRQDKNISFYRNWNDYKKGFGNLATSFFIGLDKLHAITHIQLHELEIELHDFNDTVSYANFDSFAVGDEYEKYAMQILGKYSGTAGDGWLSFNSGYKFSTYDQDNDAFYGNCAKLYTGAWWYNDCHQSNLNGEYLSGSRVPSGRGIKWCTWRGYFTPLKYAHMALRPRNSAEMRVYGSQANRCMKEKMRMSMEKRTKKGRKCKKRTKKARSCKKRSKKARKCPKRTNKTRKCKKKAQKD